MDASTDPLEKAAFSDSPAVSAAAPRAGNRNPPQGATDATTAAATGTEQGTQSGAGAKHGTDSDAGRRRSSASLASRRSSFLSRSMLNSDTISVYDSYSFSHSGLAPYNIISLKESQGFLFNQDLFATPYQQSRAWEREKRNKAMMSSKKRSKSHGNVLGHSLPFSAKQRRHTSYDDPPFRVAAGAARGLDSAVEEASNDDMSIDDSPSCTQERSLSFEGRRRGSLAKCEDNHSDDSSESEDETMEYSAIGSNYVPVVDIVVDCNGPLVPEEYLAALHKS